MKISKDQQLKILNIILKGPQGEFQQNSLKTSDTIRFIIEAYSLGYEAAKIDVVNRINNATEEEKIELDDST